MVALLTGSQGEPRAALARVAEDQHPEIALSPGDTVIFSSRTIPGNEKAVGKIINALARDRIEVITDRDGLVHVSGHPRRDELKRMYEWLKPRIVVPAHGEPAHLVAQAKLAGELGVKEVVLAYNGDLIELAPGRPGKIDEAPAGRVYQDGDVMIGAMDKTIPERRKLSFAGIVSVAVAFDDKGNLVGDPEIATMGLPPATTTATVSTRWWRMRCST